MWSLTLGLIFCVFSLLPAYFDHGERKKAFLSAKERKEKWVSGVKWILLNWGLPILAISITVAQGLESRATDREIKKLRDQNEVQAMRLASDEMQITNTSNALAAAKIKPVKQQIIDCLNSVSPEILQQLQRGKAMTKGFIPERQYTELEALAKGVEGAKYISIQTEADANGSIRQFMSDGNILRNASINLDPSLLK